MRAISASSSSGGSRHGGSGSRFPALTTLVTLAACGGIALMTAYSWSHGGGDGKLSAGDLRRRGLRTAEDAPDTASGAATNGEAAAAAAAWKAEVMDSLERLERLTKGVLKSSLQQQTATLAAATAAGAAGATAQDCTAEVAAAITSVAAAAPAAAPAQRQARPRSAIVGLAKNIDFNLLYRFVRSARQAGMRAAEVDIVLFTDAPAGDEWAWLADTYHVTLLRFDAAALPLAYRNYHPSSYRWIMIRDWMRDLPAADRYDAVFFTDVRDTIFQADVFVHTAASGPVFYAFQEARPGTIVRAPHPPTHIHTHAHTKAHTPYMHSPRAGGLRLELWLGEGLLWAGRAGRRGAQRHFMQRHVAGYVGRGVRVRVAGGKRDCRQQVRAQRRGPGHAQLLCVRRRAAGRHWQRAAAGGQ